MKYSHQVYVFLLGCTSEKKIRVELLPNIKELKLDLKKRFPVLGQCPLKPSIFGYTKKVTYNWQILGVCMFVHRGWLGKKTSYSQKMSTPKLAPPKN